MPLFGFADGRSKGPYRDKSKNVIYNLLFCDDIDLYAANNADPFSYPWNVVLSKNPDLNNLNGIINDTAMESRVRILAYRRIQSTGTAPACRELLGVIIEIGLDNGLDVLAAYKDGTARYINYSGKMLIWETRDGRADSLIKEIFRHGENVVNNTGPWEGERLPAPERGMARVTFLVSGELYFGQGPIGVLMNDGMGKPVFDSGAKLMKYLTEKALPQQ